MTEVIKSNSKPWDAPMSDREAAMPVNLRLKPPFQTRHIYFSEDVFQLLKNIQGDLERQIGRYLTNAEVLSYLIQTHPEVAAS